ncbi:POTE ankyrin domain family member J-like [Mya arenaria]|uniref:POTE ankyrin domain family member J-like n=1 Tax=Mya arenaria TaxID=6604 RepID=UPI0022E502AA|nr:POTE ankyrin domain family member J-like [Mya arenaria]XP_052781665.1 POTE ankyrin domain family member J-like [Mya arenaria]
MTSTGVVQHRQLLQASDPDFSSGLQDMNVKSLMDLITVIQQEMKKEQENFNSLSEELSTLKRSSGQYKTVSREMTASQARLTLLMDRSMKCFSQQSRKQDKPIAKAGNRKSEPVNAQGLNQSGNRNSAPIVASANSKPVSNTQPMRNSGTNSNVSNNKTLIKVQSLRPSGVNVKDRSEVNGANDDDINRLSFTEKKTIVNSALDDSTETIKPESIESGHATVMNGTAISNGNSDRKETKVNKDIPADSKPKTLGPMADQQNKPTSKSLDSLQKPDVVKSNVKIGKPSSKVVMNADKQLVDLDSFTDRKNMLSELKNFDKRLKSAPSKEKVTEVKLNLGQGNDSEIKQEEKNVSNNNSSTKHGLLGDIKLGKKPSEVKQTKAENTSESRNLETNKNANDNLQAQLFDNLLDGVDNKSEGSDHSSNSSPRENIEAFNVHKEEDLSTRNDRDSNMVVSENTETLQMEVANMATAGEITVGQSRMITTVPEESDDSRSQGSEMSQDDDRFVTEFSFPGISKPVNDQAPVTTAERKEVPVPPASKAKIEENGAKVKVTQSERSAEVKVSQGYGTPEVNEDGEELVKDTRVKFRDWDPVKVLAKLYEIKMMPDNIEDISHKFIGMEGLMEKLPMNKKKATLLKTWKRRFFRAENGWLHYFESGGRDKPSDSLQLMGGKVDELGPRVLGVDDGRGKYLMVRVPTDHEYGQWKVALESQTADNVKATYVRPAPASMPNPKKKVIIVDIGSSGIRAGILGERPTLPQVYFPSVVAVNKESGHIVVGPDAFKPEVRHTSDVVYPIQPTNKVDKFNIDMSVMTAILKKVFTDLKVDPTHYMVMLSTPQPLGQKLQERLMRILVDELHMRGACMVQQALLALYSYNAMSGIIVDIGERLDIMPIYEGVLIEGGVSRQAYGGAKIQDSLHIALLENRYRFNTPVERPLVRYIAEQACYVAEDYKAAKTQCDKDPASYRQTVELAQFDLPEGAHSSVDLDYACFKSPEGFFNTEMWEMDYKNLQKQIFHAIQQCPMDSRKHMYRSIYLSGGVTMVPGFADRLQQELVKLAPPSVVVEVHASPQRYHSAYIGACSVASMDIFEQSCVSAEEWKKLGVKACSKWGTS